MPDAPAEVWRLGLGLGLWVMLFALERTGSSAPHGRWDVRYLINLAMGGLDIILLRWVMPVGLMAAAASFRLGQVGLFAQLSLPTPLELVMGLIVFDAAIYFQHRLFHLIPSLWRFHQVHHGDDRLDTSTAVRFHPGEALISNLYKLLIIAVFGIDPATVIVAEFCLQAGALFSHASLRLSTALDQRLRWFIVTPAMHANHHSTSIIGQMSNFGFLLPWWDRIFGTYSVRVPRQLGLDTVSPAQAAGWRFLLASPFWGG